MKRKQVSESVKHITSFIENMCDKNYTDARDKLHNVVNAKIKERIKRLKGDK